MYHAFLFFLRNIKMTIAKSTAGLFSLILLTIQNILNLVLVKNARDLATLRGGPSYSEATAVVTTEYLKLAGAVLMESFFSSHGLKSLLAHFYTELYVQFKDTLILVIPAALYAVQNNMLYYANTNLDSITYQVTYQLKVLTTAVFSKALLGKEITPKRWISLCLLVTGIVSVQVANYNNATTVPSITKNPMMGFLVLILASISSGFAGVYNEKIIKQSGHPIAKKSIWTQNAIMAIYGIVFSHVTLYLLDMQKSRMTSFFHGYYVEVWQMICVQAFGGIMVSLVMRFADSIAKSFAPAVSLIFITLYCIFYRKEKTLTMNVVLGVSMVLLSIYLYATGEPEASRLAASHSKKRRLSFPNITVPRSSADQGRLADKSHLQSSLFRKRSTRKASITHLQAV